MQSRSRVLATTTPALFLAALWACSSSSPATDGQNAHDAGDGGSETDATVLDSGLGRDGGAGNDAMTGNDGGGGVDVGIVGVGNVTVTQTVVVAAGQMFPSYTIGALFSTVTSTGCTQTMAAECAVTVCQPGISVVPVSAGDVTVSGGLFASPKTLMPGPSGYTSVHGNVRAFDPGQMLTMAAAGATNGVPAFSTIVTAPSEVTITAPAFRGTMVTIDRANDLVVAWTPAGAGTPMGTVVTSLSFSPGAQMPSVSVLCAHDIAAGTATIPAATLMMIPQGMGAITIGTHGSSKVMAGDFAITAAAVIFAKTSSGSTASAIADFQ